MEMMAQIRRKAIYVYVFNDDDEGDLPEVKVTAPILIERERV